MWVEFLDENQFRVEWLPPIRDRWRNTPNVGAVEVPIAVLWNLANPQRLVEVARNQAWLDMLTVELQHRGFDKPGVVVVDRSGRIALKDGHHRLVCATALSLGVMPVRFVRAERIRSHGKQVQDVIAAMMGVA